MGKRWRPQRNPPPIIYGGVLEADSHPLARRLLRGRMIWDIVMSRAPNKVIGYPSTSGPSKDSASPLWLDPTTVGQMASPQPEEDLTHPAEQLLPRSHRTALSSYRSCAQGDRHSIGWANDPTRPNCNGTDHTVASPIKLSHTYNEPGPGGYVGGTSTGNVIPGGPPAVFRSASTADRLWLLSFLNLTPAAGPLFFFGSSVGPLHPHVLSPHFTRWVGGRLPLRYPTTWATRYLSA